MLQVATKSVQMLLKNNIYMASATNQLTEGCNSASAESTGAELAWAKCCPWRASHLRAERGASNVVQRRRVEPATLHQLGGLLTIHPASTATSRGNI